VRVFPALLIAGVACLMQAADDAPVQSEVAAAEVLPKTATAKIDNGADERATFASAEKGEAITPAAQKAVSKSDDGRPGVRLLAVKTDVAKRYSWIVPPFPIPPFTHWKKWYKDHEDAVHCALEWRDDKGQWWHGELRSTHFDVNAEQYRVGWGEFPGTAYDAYGIYIRPGRLNRDKDSQGRPLVITVDEEIAADYRIVEAEVRRYAAKSKNPGDPGTGGKGKENVGLGGPAYKPAQNSNTMVNYILKKAGVERPAPDRAVGWDRDPDFPYSSDADTFEYDNRPQR